MSFNLDWIDSDTFLIIIAIITAIYASTINGKLPIYIRNLFRNDIFRILFLAVLLIYGFKNSPHVVVAISLIFILSLYFLNYQEATENFMFLERFKSQMIKRNRENKTNRKNIKLDS